MRSLCESASQSASRISAGSRGRRRQADPGRAGGQVGWLARQSRSGRDAPNQSTRWSRPAPRHLVVLRRRPRWRSLVSSAACAKDSNSPPCPAGSSTRRRRGGRRSEAAPAPVADGWRAPRGGFSRKTRSSATCRRCGRWNRGIGGPPLALSRTTPAAGRGKPATSWPRTARRRSRGEGVGPGMVGEPATAPLRGQTLVRRGHARARGYDDRP